MLRTSLIGLILAALSCSGIAQDSRGGATPLTALPSPASTPLLPCSAVAVQVKGLLFSEVRELLDKQGVLFRVEAIEGHRQVMTMDFNEDRLNLTVVHRKVASAHCG